MDSKNGQGSNLDAKTEAGMQRLINRLPEWQAKIEQLVQQDEDFREICQDYEDVTQVIANMRQNPLPDAPRYIAEYETLLRELEDEALSYLQDRA